MPDQRALTTGLTGHDCVCTTPFSALFGLTTGLTKRPRAAARRGTGSGDERERGRALNRLVAQQAIFCIIYCLLPFPLLCQLY